MNFKKINNVTGWIVFAFALIVYLISMEKTGSFWDCGEFLATADKLQVGHSPGAPLFMIFGRLFAMVAPSPAAVGMYVNAMSALMSAFTILLLFWSITHFARKFFSTQRYGEDLSRNNVIAIIGAGLVGALAYTFSDTFWFSAVEAEVYATSSCFTAFVFWAILKWEDSCNEPNADRWLILIAYMVGLSVGVHLLSLLVLPTCALIYYYKRYEVKTSGAIIAFVIGSLILALVQYGVIQYIPIFASKFELLFVNGLGLPLNSGALFFIILLGAIMAALLIWTKRSHRYAIHLATLCLMFVSIGYIFSYIPTLIRAKAGVSINMTNPDNVMALVPYLQREQYGSIPLVYGQDFDSRTSLSADDPKPVYGAAKVDGKDKYVEIGKQKKYEFDKERFFPRIWENNDQGKVRFYRDYLNLSETDEPTGADNLKFFMSYQVNWMFWRYFMWNYSGRQNDYEGQGEARNGNWITGINFIDKAMGKGDYSKLSDGIKNNRAHNKLYMLPFIVGIIGLIYQFMRRKLDGYIVLSLFFFTGLAVQLYINNTPMQPRERDYQYVAAYPFAIWIGIGVLAIRDWLQRIIKSADGAAIASTAICLIAVPALMASQEWDDHTRAHKTLPRDHAYNMLMTCDSNAILITYGDNDTYPLWYLQEVEGIRKDVRIINYNLLGTDWQNVELFSKVNDADAIPMIWKANDFIGEKLEVAPVVPNPRIAQNQFYPVEDILKFVADPSKWETFSNGEKMGYLPAKNLIQPLDKNALLKSGLVSIADSSYIPEGIQIVLNQSYLQRAELALLNIIAGIAKDGWKRSIYFTDGVPNLGLSNYYKSEGILNKVVPIVKPPVAQGVPQYTDLDKNIKLLNNYSFGKANTNQVYYDEKNKVMFINYFIAAAELANNLTLANRKEDAIKILDKMTSNISQSSYPYEMVLGYDRGSIPMIAEAYYRAGATDKARKIGEVMYNNLKANSNYFFDLSESGKNGMLQYMQFDLVNFNNVIRAAGMNGDTTTAQRWAADLSKIADRAGFGNQQQQAPPAQVPIAIPKN